MLGASGAVGFAAVQFAKALGARVLAGIATPDKIDLARLAGADVVIELWRPDLHDSLRAQVHAATAGEGADIILDPVGGEVFDAALRALAWRGRMVVIGFAAGQIPTIKANYLLLKNIEVSGLQVSDYKKKAPAEVARCFAELFGLYEDRQAHALRHGDLSAGTLRRGLAASPRPHGPAKDRPDARRERVGLKTLCLCVLPSGASVFLHPTVAPHSGTVPAGRPIRPARTEPPMSACSIACAGALTPTCFD